MVFQLDNWERARGNLERLKSMADDLATSRGHTFKWHIERAKTADAFIAGECTLCGYSVEIDAEGRVTGNGDRVNVPCPGKR